MITTSFSYRTNSTNGPFEYHWTADQSCMQVTQTSTTSTNGIFPVTLSASDVSCFLNTQLTLLVIDADNCPATVTIDAPNPCNNFTVNPISFTEPYTFTVTATNPDCSSLSFSWDYDTGLLTQSSLLDTSFSSTLTLDIVPDLNYPATTEVSVIVTDCNGCEETVSYTFLICTPVAAVLSANMYCNSTSTAFQDVVVIWPEPDGCEGYAYDWSTLSLGNLPTGLTYTPNPSNPQLGTFSGTLGTLFHETFNISYTVDTDFGLTSDPGNIFIIVHACQAEQTISAPDTWVQIDCSNIVGDLFYIPIDVYSAEDTVIDWDTWTLVEPPISFTPDPELDIVLGPDPGTAPHILYRIPALTGTDTFGWSVCDTEGNCAVASTYTVILDCPTPPTAVDDDACVSCGEVVIIDVLDNDLVNGSLLDINSIVITSAPSGGVVIILGDGTLQYTPNATFTGDDTFTYTVANVSGEVSNEGTVTVEVNCSGEDGTTITCND